MTRPRLAILPQIRTYQCRRCPVEVTYRPGNQPPPGAAYQLCPRCEVEAITQPDADVLTDPDADVRNYRAHASRVAEILNAPTYTPDLEIP